MEAKTEIILILEDIRSTHNVGSIFRTADVFGVKEIYLCGYTPYPLFDGDTRLPHLAKKITNQISKTALGAEKSVEFQVFDTIQEAINIAKFNGYKIASLEQNPKSLTLNSYRPGNKTALILGNELSGVSKWTIDNSDVILEIKQYGKKESLNVANAAAIAMYALSN